MFLIDLPNQKFEATVLGKFLLQMFSPVQDLILIKVNND